MTTVTIVGWNEGLNKVRLNHLLRQHAGYGLAEAKQAVDRLLAGEPLTLDLPDPASASAFRRSAEGLGAICGATAEAQPSDPTPSAPAGRT